MTRSFLTGSFLLLCLISAGQMPSLNPAQREIAQTRTDTGRIRVLLKWGDFYLDRRGTEKNDLDSAMLLLMQARDLSSRSGTQEDVDHADRSIGSTMIEGKDYASLHKQFARVSDPVRIHLIEILANFETNLYDRGTSNPDTVVAFIREVLPLVNSAQSLVRKLVLLQRLALINYFSGDILKEPAPSSSWVAHSTVTTGIHWTDSVFDWIAAHLRKDKGLLTALDQCRQGFRTAYPRYSRQEQKYLLENVRTTFSNATVTQADNNFYQSNKALTEKEYQLAIDFDKAGDTLTPTIYNNLASFYILSGDLDKALFYALESVRRMDTLKTHQQPSELPYWITGQIYASLKKYPLAMEYYQKTLSVLHESGLQMNENFLSDVVKCYNYMKQPADGLAFLKANIDSSRLDDKEYRRMAEDALGNAYFNLKEYRKAEYFWLSSYELNKQMHPLDAPGASMNLGALYYQMKQYDNVKKYLEPLIANSTKYFVSLHVLATAHLYLFEADSATGNYISAIRHLQANKQISDSIFNATKNRQAEELRVKYDTDRKDQDLRLQQAELRNGLYIRNGLIAGAIALICLLSLGYARYRSKQKSNRLLHDLTQRQQRLLREKEWLMREIHHRVKNNLQIIISLLNMQGSYLKDELALDAFSEISSRIRAISLIHQKLYKEGMDMAVIDMREYVDELIGFLRDSMAISSSIRFSLNIEPLRLGVVQCVPVGLILNEAVTNAIKYAFPPALAARTTPQITIALKTTEDGNIELIISDNGVGLPENFSHRETMGFELIEMLSEQLEGALALESKDGLTIHLIFPGASEDTSTLTFADNQYNLSK